MDVEVHGVGALRHRLEGELAEALLEGAARPGQTADADGRDAPRRAGRSARRGMRPSRRRSPRPRSCSTLPGRPRAAPFVFQGSKNGPNHESREADGRHTFRMADLGRGDLELRAHRVAVRKPRGELQLPVDVRGHGVIERGFAARQVAPDEPHLPIGRPARPGELRAGRRREARQGALERRRRRLGERQRGERCGQEGHAATLRGPALPAIGRSPDLRRVGALPEERLVEQEGVEADDHPRDDARDGGRERGG